MKRFSVGLLSGLLVLGLGGMVLANGADPKDGGDEKPMALASAPAPVQATLKAQAAGGKILKVWTENEDGKTSWVASIVVKKRKFEAEVAPDGTLVGTEEPVKLKDVPAPVRKTITDKLAGRKLKELELRTESGKSFYEFVIKGVAGEIAVAADGSLMPSEADRESAAKK